MGYTFSLDFTASSPMFNIGGGHNNIHEKLGRIALKAKTG
jgi:hypothetical protein